MGSYENIVKIEEMRKRMEEGDTASAQRILDTMEIKKIKNMSDLSLIAEVYAENGRYEEAARLYLKIYEKTKTRKALFYMVDISIKRNNAKDAEYYLDIYRKYAPKDFYNYIFRYRIDKLKGEPYETLIKTLKTLKKTEYMEKWAYELAKTYYKAGMEKECIRECSDIILWFGEGVYVEKAKILRSYFSGGKNKEKTMQELKRRAMGDGGRNIDSDRPEKEPVNLETGLKKDVRNMMEDGREQEPEEQRKEAEVNVEIRPASAEIAEDEDVKEIVSEEIAEEEDVKEIVSAEIAEEDDIDKTVSAAEIMEEGNLNEMVSPGQDMTGGYDSRSERDQAEQEVENTIYQLLQEEDMDEDEKKLNRIIKELCLNPEELFGNFLHVRSVKRQLVKSLEELLDEHSGPVRIIITGDAGSGKTALAKDIMIFLDKAGRLKSSRIAKIKAERLNAVDIMSRKEILKDCCLLVENAGELHRQAIDSLLEICDNLKENIAVIFEENKKNINKLFTECPKLMDLFKNRIHLPEYTPEELAGFACTCLRQQDYQLASKAKSILQYRINQIVKQFEPPRHLEQVYNLMQSVMDAADIRTGRQLSKSASQEKLKVTKELTVLPEDFAVKP